MTYISSNNDGHPVTNTYTPLHYTLATYISLHATIESPFLPYTSISLYALMLISLILLWSNTLCRALLQLVKFKISN